MTTISLPRLRTRIETLARFGALPGGGVTRSAWSPPHEEARDWLVDEMKRAGLAPWTDAAGNTFGGLGMERFDPARPAVVTGSHIDTVPEGGILDGALGVLAGLEALHAMREGGVAHARPLAVAAWSDEEGRYGSLFGSRAFCGRLEADRVSAMAASDGERLVDVMARAGFDAMRAPEAAAPAGAVAAYVELHIEQGPHLEEAGIPIGVVEAIAGVRRNWVTFVGQADHAGTTPMERRRDGFLAAAEYALKARDLVVKRGSGRSVTNFGVVQVHPGVGNIVPARGALLHEMREPDPAVLDRLAKECETLAKRVARRRHVQAAIAAAAQDLGLATRHMHSAAGHDAQNLALITDAGMIFIPSKGGRSHRVDEMSDWDAIERGANVLLRTLVALAT